MPLNLLAITWDIASVEEAGYSTGSSLAFSPSGQPAIAYYSSLKHAIRFAEQDSHGTWEVSTVDTLFGDCFSSLAFRFDQPAISYGAAGTTADPFRELRYALRRGSPPWSIERVASGWNTSSLAIGPLHRPGISFRDSDGHTLRYTYSDTPSIWIGETVDDDQHAGFFNALAYTPSGRPAIAYHDSRNDLIKYAAFDGKHWIQETVGEGKGWVSLAFAPSGEPAVSYTHAPKARQPFVMYAVRQGASWNPEVIAPGDSSWLAFTPAGEPAISYRDRVEEAIKYAVFRDRNWYHFLVQQTGKDQDGNWAGPFTLTSLAFSPTGQPAISYYDRANGTIRYAIGTLQNPLSGTLSSQNLLSG